MHEAWGQRVSKRRASAEPPLVVAMFRKLLENDLRRAGLVDRAGRVAARLLFDPDGAGTVRRFADGPSISLVRREPDSMGGPLAYEREVLPRRQGPEPPTRPIAAAPASTATRHQDRSLGRFVLGLRPSPPEVRRLTSVLELHAESQ